MSDYIGSYVKKFESGSKGSLAIGQSGNDWGLSIGSYQLTLRWGNCIRFLKTFFPQKSTSLYYKASKDFASKEYPGLAYCSSPEAVISVWMSCYNGVGANKFFEYEHQHMQNTYYDKVKEKIKDIIDLDTADRGFQECFWSWGIHKGVSGCVTAFQAVLTEHNIESLDYVDKNTFFDWLYDKRYEINMFNRFRKGLTNGSSERETLRPLIGAGTFSGKTKEEAEKEPEIPVVEEVEPVKEVTDARGVATIIYKGSDGLNVRTAPSFSAPIAGILSYGVDVEVTGVTTDGTMYQISNTYYISASPSYVQFVKADPYLYKVRIATDELNIRTGPGMSYGIVGTVKKNQVFTIVEEAGEWGKLKSGAGWLYLKGYTKKC